VIHAAASHLNTSHTTSGMMTTTGTETCVTP
jgi:hypothetical protein